MKSRVEVFSDCETKFKAWLLSRGVSDSSADHYVSYLKAIGLTIEPHIGHSGMWCGLYQLLTGQKPFKDVYEIEGLADFSKCYGSATSFFVFDTAAKETLRPLYPSCANFDELYDFAHSTSAKKNGDGGHTRNGFTRYLQFLAELELQVDDSAISKPSSVDHIEARQLITYGAPGSGKSWSVKEWTKNKDTIRTTFHPDSDYSTFVGSYKPSVEKDKFQTVVTAGERNAAGTLNKKDELFTQKRIVYKFVAQSFIKAYVDAWKYKAAANGGEATRKYLVIEEINRGNCAQIFGDLFQLLDRNDEGFSDYEIAADDDLQNYLAEQFADLAKQNESSPINLGVDAKLAKRILSGEVMLLPENLYIWATMNTSDQSLFPIDSAFKCRWEWKYMPIYDAQKDYKIVVDGDVYKWWDFLEKANALVQEFTDSEDKKLGYFFCKADASNTIPLEQFVGKVIFYLWNDVFKDAGFNHAAFDGDNGERLLFKTFFNPDGSPKAATVKKLMQNLGVPKVAEMSP